MQTAPFTGRTDDTPAKVRVWDRFIRLFHWSLVACVTTAAVTGFLLGPRWVPVHLWAGGIAAVLVVARVIWGVWGPTHARFAGFVRGPGPVLAHLRAILGRGAGRRYIGHNPLGALMIVTLFAAVLALAATGLVVWGGMLKAGPLAFAASFDTATLYRHVHKAIAIGVLVLVALHLGGVVVESRRERENLARAMIDGHKPARPGDVAVPARAALTGRAVAIGLGAAAAAGSAGLALSALPAPHLPVAPAAFDAAYASECSACHGAFNPSLLPAASWALLMQGLGDHFGEDASLDPATTARISTWLQAHAAGSADTLAAHRLSRVAPDHPTQITATRFWVRMHRRIPDSTFATPAVGARSNCAACHADAAAGLFRPGSISIPEEAEN